MKTLDVDQYLNDSAVEVKLNGKTFVVKDVYDETRQLMDKGEDEMDPKEVVKSLLGCTDEDLKGYGMVAFNKIITDVTENLFPSSSQSDQSQG